MQKEFSHLKITNNPTNCAAEMLTNDPPSPLTFPGYMEEKPGK